MPAWPIISGGQGGEPLLAGADRGSSRRRTAGGWPPAASGAGQRDHLDGPEAAVGGCVRGGAASAAERQGGEQDLL